MISRSGDTVTFISAPGDVEILDFIESKMQLPDMERLIQIFIDQRRQQREYDTKVELRALIDDPISQAQMEEVIQDFKDRHGLP